MNMRLAPIFDCLLDRVRPNLGRAVIALDNLEVMADLEYGRDDEETEEGPTVEN